MLHVALAWHWARRVAAPIVGFSKPERVDQAVGALDLQLTDDEVAYLQEPYVAHSLVGPLAPPGDQANPGAINVAENANKSKENK